MFERVKVLHVAGNGIRAIVRETGFNWRTVAKWVQLDELPERNVMAPKSTTPGKFQTYLSRRWAEGCTTGRDLLPEINCLGYTGSLSQLECLLTKWRHAGHAVVFDAPAAKAGILTDPSTGQLVSPIVAAALCIKLRGLLTEPQADKVDAFGGQMPSLLQKRWTIEPGFRDSKDLRFGMGLSVLRIGDPQRRDRLLLLNALAILLLTLLGAAGESLGMDRLLKSSTVQPNVEFLGIVSAQDAAETHRQPAIVANSADVDEPSIRPCRSSATSAASPGRGG